MKTREMLAWLLLIIVSATCGVNYIERQGLQRVVRELQQRADDAYAEQREMQRDYNQSVLDTI